MCKTKNKMERTNITLPMRYKNLLRIDSKRLGVSMSECIRRLIDEKIKKNRKGVQK